MKFDIAIIGGGPGGYTAAEKAAKAGRSVVLFEKEDLGGLPEPGAVCPPKPCSTAPRPMPPWATPRTWGVQAQEIHYDFAAMHQRKDQVVATLPPGGGEADEGQQGHRGGQAGPASRRPAWSPARGRPMRWGTSSSPPAPRCPIPHPRPPSARGVQQPGHPGGGRPELCLPGHCRRRRVGVECATLYRCLGCEVTVLEAADHILPFMDREIAQRLTMILKKQGVKVEAKASVQKIEGTPAP